MGGVERALYGVLVRDEGPVRVVALDRDERRNAIDLEIRPVLAGVIEEADRDPGVRALVLTGRGEAFCAGGDLRIMERMPAEAAVPRLEAAQRIVRAIAGGRTPVVAAVNGIAFAAGLGLALACDRVVAADTARFTASFTRVGLAADLGVTWSLSRRVGPARAQQMMMFGDLLDAEQALRAGLVDTVVPRSDLLAVALADARRLAEAPPRAIALLKQHFRTPPTTLDEALGREVEIQSELMDTDDFAEGIAAIAERRPPTFVGR
ncbi:enoyl-CoA hydratase/isomerase family protein [Streptomyces gilvus]|uniref:enoyl-CoA hydratase/isomerase family protein n=1 Tax=Streptomyces gilvus TaxID=2920937 RepID=UPI001F0E9A08|nr:enoyl-CoA hydratase-related protein [Streptomyces sp. CME 23]MCH5677595.1 enoyl-CoA hydratase-related protein [Streptomyces sp. CME 23]